MLFQWMISNQTANNEKWETVKRSWSINSQIQQPDEDFCDSLPIAFPTWLRVLYTNTQPLLMGYNSVFSYLFCSEDCAVWRKTGNFISVCVHTHAHLCSYIHMCTLIYIFTSIYNYVYIYVNIYIYFYQKY